jgi:hypothetical protein
MPNTPLAVPRISHMHHGLLSEIALPHDLELATFCEGHVQSVHVSNSSDGLHSLNPRVARLPPTDCDCPQVSERIA